MTHRSGEPPSEAPARLQDPGLAAIGIDHGFGLRGDPGPADLERPRQVHGIAVHHAARAGESAEVEADAIVCRSREFAIGVVTADCVPILVASKDGGVVAAIHAGWRGLCAGVIESGVRAMGAAPALAAIGPHVGACCYEVDAPVLDAVRARFGQDLPEGAIRPGRPGHAHLGLASLVGQELRAVGVPETAIGGSTAACTACDAERFHSYRRDGPRSGRLVHFIRAAGAPGEGPETRS